MYFISAATLKDVFPFLPDTSQSRRNLAMVETAESYSDASQATRRTREAKMSRGLPTVHLMSGRAEAGLFPRRPSLKNQAS